MMAGLGSSSRPLASAEAVAFRQSSYVLLDAITEPEVFVWKLYSDGIVTETSRDRVCSKCTRLERNSVLLEVLESRIKTSPQTYHQVVSLCDDPILQSVRNQLRSAYDKASVYHERPLTGPVLIPQLLTRSPPESSPQEDHHNFSDDSSMSSMTETDAIVRQEHGAVNDNADQNQDRRTGWLCGGFVVLASLAICISGLTLFFSDFPDFDCSRLIGIGGFWLLLSSFSFCFGLLCCWWKKTHMYNFCVLLWLLQLLLVPVVLGNGIFSFLYDADKDGSGNGTVVDCDDIQFPLAIVVVTSLLCLFSCIFCCFSTLKSSCDEQQWYRRPSTSFPV